MWILMEKTYSGPLGCFVKGQKYDLPETTVKKLPTQPPRQPNHKTAIHQMTEVSRRSCVWNVIAAIVSQRFIVKFYDIRRGGVTSGCG